MCWRMPLAQHILSAHRAGQRVRGGHAAPVFETVARKGAFFLVWVPQRHEACATSVALQKEVEHLADRRPAGTVVNNTIE